MKQSIVSLAQVIRSKNAGPYELVLDILFKTKENYERVKSSGQLTPELDWPPESPDNQYHLNK